ncbi:hypothetical protein P7H06_25495 [Paenibacillus larvae]|nr:hypothetical protein [Paenibacillus larvae]MDT2262173.1 hypothetical protein [Paenibacillus larvae]
MTVNINAVDEYHSELYRRAGLARKRYGEEKRLITVSADTLSRR